MIYFFKKTIFSLNLLIFILFFFTINNVYSNELENLNNDLKEIQNEINELSSLKEQSNQVISSSLKELGKAIDYADLAYSTGDLDATYRTLDYLDKALSGISKNVKEEVINEIDSMESFDQKSIDKLSEITQDINKKNEKELINFIENLMIISENSDFDPFQTSKNLNDMGVEGLGFEAISEALEGGEYEFLINPNKQAAYWTARLGLSDIKQGLKSKEDLAKDVEAAMLGGLDQKIHWTKKMMENTGATVEEINKEVEALKAIDAGELDELSHYRIKYAASFAKGAAESAKSASEGAKKAKQAAQDAAGTVSEAAAQAAAETAQETASELQQVAKEAAQEAKETVQEQQAISEMTNEEQLDVWKKKIDENTKDFWKGTEAEKY